MTKKNGLKSFTDPCLKWNKTLLVESFIATVKNMLCNTDAERKSLYTLFLESVQSRLRSQDASPSGAVTEQQASRKSLIQMQSVIAQHLQIEDLHDPLLAINFARSDPVTSYPHFTSVCPQFLFIFLSFTLLWGLPYSGMFTLRAFWPCEDLRLH